MNEKKEKMKTEEPGRGAVTFRILFIVLWVLAIAFGIAMFFLPRYSSRIGASGFTQFCANVATSVSSHLHTLFLFNTTFRSRSVHQTGALEFACLVLVAIMLIYFIFKPVVLMGYVKRAHKKNLKLRNTFFSIMIALNVLIVAVGLLICFRNYVAAVGGPLFKAYKGAVDGIIGFAKGHARIHFLFTFGNRLSDYASAFAWLAVAVLVFNILCDCLIALCGKRESAAVAAAPEANKAEEEKAPVAQAAEASAAAVLVEAVNQAPLASEEKPAAEVPPVKEAVPAGEKLVPTRRDMAILDTLEPFDIQSLDVLPGLYETNVDQVIEDLEPSTLKEAEIPEASETEKNALKEPVPSTPVKVLPGVDETNANPWNEEKQVKAEEEKPVLAQKEETPKEDLTAQAKPAEAEKQVVTEAKPAETKPAEKPAEKPVEEAKPAEEKKSPWIAINDLPKDDKRPQEEDHPVTQEAKSDGKQKAYANNNDHNEIVTKPTTVTNDWKLPEYKEEAKPVEAPKPVEEAKPVEKPAEKPAVKPMAPFAPIHKPEGNRPTGPINLVNPMKHEEAKPAEEEKKTIAPIKGPMHSINTNKKDIKPVEARHVKFDLKRYQVKTYSGNLTPEEAFSKGVTKVQPLVTPVIGGNQGDASSWKAKRRQEDLRANGYENVTTVETLTPVKPQAKTNDATANATSLRDLAKANKAKEEAAPAETPATPEAPKPIRPIAPVQPVNNETKPAAAKPAEEKKPEPVKPMALNPVNRPAPANKPKPIAPIKPVTPVKK
jgi:hypothetical protein